MTDLVLIAHTHLSSSRGVNDDNNHLHLLTSSSRHNWLTYLGYSNYSIYKINKVSGSRTLAVLLHPVGGVVCDSGTVLSILSARAT